MRLQSFSLMAFLSMAIICGCSNQETRVTPQVDVTADEDIRFKFSGKGAGAGMMLSSSMGPMGIAIGIAIDEGIAKTIAENASDISFPDLLKNELELWAKTLDSKVKTHLLDEQRRLHVHIKQYGIKTWPEGDDSAIANFELLFKVDKAQSAKPLSVRYPETLANNQTESKPFSPKYAPLERVKTESELVESLFRDGIKRTLAYVSNKKYE